MTTSNLREQFPLSKRKFWKKMIEKIIIFAVFGALIGVLVGVTLASSSLSGLATFSWSAVAFVLVTVFLAVLYGIYVRYYIKFYYYSDDGDFVTIKKGVFAPTEIHVQYLKIQDVFVDQDILDRIMGLYDVHISSATYSSGIEAHIDGVEKIHADGLKNLLLGKIKSSSHRSTGPDPVISGEAKTESIPLAAKFSAPISSEAYGLSSKWWMSEFVKLAIGSIVTPLLVSFWLYFSVIEDDGELADISNVFYVWVVVFVGTIIYRLGYLYLWKSHYQYSFGEEYIYMKIGVLSVSEKNMAYNTIQDVKVNQSFIDRIFGVADVIIENSSPGFGPISSGKGQIPAGTNGIVIEGLILADAKKIADEMKQVLIKKVGLNKGL